MLNIPGMHNVLNSLAAIAVATELGVDDVSIQKALAEFHGVGRRFQRYGEVPLATGGSFMSLIRPASYSASVSSDALAFICTTL